TAGEHRGGHASNPLAADEPLPPAPPAPFLASPDVEMAMGRRPVAAPALPHGYACFRTSSACCFPSSSACVGVSFPNTASPRRSFNFCSASGKFLLVMLREIPHFI